MRFSPTQLLSQLRLARRAAAASSRFYTVSALNPNLSDSEQQQQVINNHLKVGNFDSNLSNLNESRVLRVLNSTRDDPNLSFSFLRQLKQNGVSLSVDAYATVVKILSCWGLDRKLDSVLVELIRNEERGFCILDLISAIGEEEADEEKRSFYVIRVSSALVKACVSLGMFDKAIDVLIQCHHLGCVPCVKACNFLMNRLIAFRETDMVVALFRQLKHIGVSANEYTYTIVIKALCRKGDLDGAAKLLGETSSVFAITTFIEGLCGNQKTEKAVLLIEELVKVKTLAGDDLGTAYRMVVRGFCNEMNVEAAEEVIFGMVESGIGPDVYACSLVIDRHCKNKDSPKALVFFEKMLEKGLKVNCFIVSGLLQCYCEMKKYSEALDKFKEYRDGKKIFLDKVCYNVALDALSKLGKVEEGIELLQEMVDKRMVPDVINYTTLVDGYLLEGRYVDALDLVDEMRRNGISPDVITYNVVAGGFARKGEVKEAFDNYHVMINEGLKPSAVTDNVIIEGLCSAKKIEEAENFFKSLENKSPENYGSLLKGYCDSGLCKKAFRLLVELNFPLRKSVYYKLFSSLYNEKDCLDKALVVLKRMLVYGVEPGRNMYGTMIRKLCGLEEPRLREAQLVFDTMVRRGIIPDLVTYTIMIHTYCRVNELQKADDLFEDMKQRGIKPDVVTYTVLLDTHLKLDHETVSVKGGVQKRKASEVFGELQAAGVELDVVCYTVLIDSQCKIPNLEFASKLLDQMIDSGLKPDIVTYSALISGYCRKGYVGKAATLVKEFAGEDISLDEHLFATVRRAVLKTKRLQLRK